jgi:hypothetical protein
VGTGPVAQAPLSYRSHQSGVVRHMHNGLQEYGLLCTKPHQQRAEQQFLGVTTTRSQATAPSTDAEAALGACLLSSAATAATELDWIHVLHCHSALR